MFPVGRHVEIQAALLCFDTLEMKDCFDSGFFFFFSFSALQDLRQKIVLKFETKPNHFPTIAPVCLDGPNLLFPQIPASHSSCLFPSPRLRNPRGAAWDVFLLLPLQAAGPPSTGNHCNSFSTNQPAGAQHQNEQHR